jgi:hypothetical protein
LTRAPCAFQRCEVDHHTFPEFKANGSGSKNWGVTILADGEIVLFVFRAADSTAGVSLTQIWTPISLTNSSNCRIFDAADCAAEGCRMRSNDKPVVGDMRKRMTRRCFSAATGACR